MRPLVTILIFVLTSDSLVAASLLIVADGGKRFEFIHDETLESARQSEYYLELNCDNREGGCIELVACENTGWWAYVLAYDRVSAACAQTTRQSALNAARKMCEINMSAEACRPRPAEQGGIYCVSGLDQGLYQHNSPVSDEMDFSCQPEHDFQYEPKTYLQVLLETRPKLESGSSCAMALNLEEKPTLLFFYAEWAGPAVALKNVIGSIRSQYPNLNLKLIDYHKDKQVFAACQNERTMRIDAVPMLVGIVSRRVVVKELGFRGDEDRQQIEEVFALMDDFSG